MLNVADNKQIIIEHIVRINDGSISTVKTTGIIADTSVTIVIFTTTSLTNFPIGKLSNPFIIHNLTASTTA